METKNKFKPGMIYRGKILIINVIGDSVEYFNLENATKYIAQAGQLSDLLGDCEPISCKDVFISKYQMNEED